MLRRIHRIVLLFVLLLGCARMSYVQAATYSGSCGTNATWSYNTINYKLTISGSGAMTNYTSSSPAPWDSYKKSILTISIANTITSIGDYAFANCTKAALVSIGTGVKSIGSNAFRGCSFLSSVTIPNGVTTIGDAAFYNCTSLVYVSIPNSVTRLGSQAFYGCTKLTWISIPNSVTKLGTYTLSGSGIVDIYVYWTTTSGDHCIPVWTTGFVTKVPQTAVTLHVPCGTRSMYMGLTGWRDFTVVEPQYTITAKTNNSSYGTVKIDDGTIGAEVSKTVNCATNVTLTAVTTTSNCNIGFLQWNDGVKNNPRTVTAESSITYTAQFGTIGGNCGASGNNLTWSLNRCTGVLTISGSGAMKDFTASTTGYDGDGTNAPWNDYRSSITKVVLPYGLTNIGVYAFYYCDHLTDIDIPASVTSIGDKAFAGCTSLKQVCIPEGVTTIGSYLFFCMTSNTSSLQRLYLPSTLTSMGTHVVYKCGNLRDFTIPASISGWSGNMRYSRGPKENVYVSWTENIPTCPLTNEIVPSPRATLHVPYGKTSQYNTKQWYKSFIIVEDVDERAIDLGLSIRWASCNVGATAPEENGNFYAWGDTLTRSSFTWGTYPYSGTSTNTMTKYCTRAANGTIDNRSTLIAFDDAAYINWGETWRMPTWTEWNELITQCTWKETMYNDVPVWQVTGPNGNSIYLPKVGYKNSTSVTAGCYYWSSTLNTANSNDQCNRALYINAANRSSAMYGLRYVGMPVRAVYRREWPSFTLTITDTPEGTSYTKAINAAASYTLTAKEDACHQFVRWSDGNTDNPRTVTVTEDATYTAQYEDLIYSGTCGAEGNETNVTWELSLCDSVLTISGSGAMKDWTTQANMPWNSYKGTIKTVVIEDGVTNIGGTSFIWCTKLSSVTIPESVTSIGHHAFCGCTSLKSVELPSHLESIGRNAFESNSFTSIRLPETLSTMGIYIFGGSSKVTDIYVEWTENIPDYPTFKGNITGITLHVPCGTQAIYQAADGWKDFTIEGEGSYTITVTTDDASMGSVSITEN